MSLIKSNTAGLGGSGSPGGALGSFYSHTIDQSLRFDGSTSFLYFTPTSNAATDSSKMTFSTWVKTWGFGMSDGYILSAGSSYIDGVGYTNADQFTFVRNGSTAVTGNGVRRDPASWYHLYVTYEADGDQKVRIYVNGVLDNEAAQTTDLGKLGVQNQLQRLVRKSNASTYLDLYLAETHFVDGSIVPIGTFAETKDGVWIPVKTSGITYGNNGWYLDYADSSDIGKDVSGRGNHWTSSGLSASDVVPDSPTGKNFATMNPLMISDARVNSSAVYSEGNLKVAGGGFSTSSIGGGYSTIAIPKDKKIYIEVCETGIDGNYWSAGILIDNHVQNSTQVSGDGAISAYNRQVYINGVETDYGSSAGLGGLGVTRMAAGDVLGVAVDGATGKVWFHRNGTYFKSPSTNDSGTTGNPSAGTNEIGTVNNTASNNPSGEIFFFIGNHGGSDNCIVNFGQDSTFAGSKSAGSETDSNGDGLFQYAVPTDYVCLHSGNMSDVTIGPTQSSQADDHFNTVLYTGNGNPNSNSQSITGVGFQPDWVWIKSRGVARHHMLYDSVRGATKAIRTSLTTAEITGATTLTSFDSDGFSLGADSDVNTNAEAFVSWNWKAGGSASSNSNGSITSSVSANTDAGFSIVSFTGNSTNPSTIGHGLSKAPEYIIYKSRDATNGTWYVSSDEVGWTSRLKLDATSSTAASSALWNNTAPTNSVFTISSSLNYNGDDIIAYCFHSVEGYSKVGSYTGNATNYPNGAFIYTGFRPALVVVKASSTTSNWIVTDNKRASSFNGETARLYWNTNGAETAYNSNRNVELFSNGFKVHGNSASDNANRINESASYIYLAFAEAPFKFANAR